MVYRPTTAYSKIRNAAKDNKIICCQGGQGASKTVSIEMLLANNCFIKDRPVEISILGHELTKLKQGAILDFKNIMKSWNRFDNDRWVSNSYYKFPNGSFIEFLGLDRADVGKGLRRDLVYFNEANRGISFDTFHQVASRVRHKVFIDFNPDYNFWAHTQVLTRDDAVLVNLTHEDNEFLPNAERKEILSYKEKGYHSNGEIKNHYWANKWRVYGLGLVGKIEGLVFPDCGITDEDFDPEIYGLDFGFTNDPTTLIGLRKVSGRLKGKQFIHEKGLTNQDISDRMDQLGIPRSSIIVADSAEPKSIEELKRLGWNVVGALKGKDSIAFGIQLIKQYGIDIYRKSLEWIEESNSYRYVMKGTEKTNKPVDKFNHCWDAARYAASYKYGTTGPPISDEDFFTLTI